MCECNRVHNCRSRSFQGQPRSLILVPIESAYMISYFWLIVTFVISRTVSEIRRVIGWTSPIRTHPTLIQRPRSGCSPSNFGMNVISPETRMTGLPYGEEIMIVGRTMWTQSTSVTDGQTDRQTDRITITNTVQRRASHDKQEAQLLLGDRATRKHTKDSWNVRGNDNLGWNDLQMYFKVIKSGTNRKLVYDFLLVFNSNFCCITPWNMPKVIDSRITWKLSCGYVCKMFGRQWTNEAKISSFNYPIFNWRPLSIEPPRISA